VVGAYINYVSRTRTVHAVGASVVFHQGLDFVLVYRRARKAGSDSVNNSFDRGLGEDHYRQGGWVFIYSDHD